jgi:hypothetical protein
MLRISRPLSSRGAVRASNSEIGTRDRAADFVSKGDGRCRRAYAGDAVDRGYRLRVGQTQAHKKVEGDRGLKRTGWAGDRENPLLGQALWSAGEC